jgi:anaerobic selenocysteine-containing dehydrogenase
LGLGRFGLITNNDLYDGILDPRPNPIRGLMAFGGNVLAGRGSVLRGREALKSLEFFVCSELFMTPTAELADIVLPAAVSVERDALRIGFEINEDAQSLLQFRQKLVEPPGEARSDVDMVFDLAVRLGLGEYFWNGDVDAAYQYQLGPSGLTLEALRAAPGGLRVPLRTHHEKYTRPDKTGTPAGFATPTRKAEIYSELFLTHGYAPLPEFVEPAASPARSPPLAARFPLVLTSAKPGIFCDSQHRNIPRLRRRTPHPEVELHPEAAVSRGISAGDWVSIETPEGQVRARARFNKSLDPRVVVGQHGWWQACPELGLPGYDPFSPEGANLNLLVSGEGLDPISGTPPARANVCEIRKVP